MRSPPVSSVDDGRRSDGRRRQYSACPHDCPSTCSLEVELDEVGALAKVKGSHANTYTDGVICSKVARYVERSNHPDRLTRPLRRVGAKGDGRFEPTSWDDALDTIAERFLEAEHQGGTESVWPYYFAGTMGLVMRDGINRLRHVKKYSHMHQSICTTLAWTGFIAGTGRLSGPDPREMAKSDAIVIWGTNPAHTQVNVMSHATRARKERGAKIIAIDVYRNATVHAADIAVLLRPGTDGALACAIMHCVFRDGRADWPYLKRYTDCPERLEAHLKTRTPEWASAITGVPTGEIEALAAIIGTTKRTYFRLGYGFTRHRNGAHSMHAASCIAAVTGAWQFEGGGAFHNNGAIFGWNKTMIEGLDARDPGIRTLDMSRIGAVLTGDRRDLGDGPEVKALLIQNMNPAQVAPEQKRVRAGMAREDLFVATHEQFMTATAKLSDIVLPATMFLEHDDVYQGGGHQHILFGPKLIDPPGECRSNHEVITGLAKRLGADHPGFDMSPRQLIEWTLRESGWGTLGDLEEKGWIDCQPDFASSHFIGGFAYQDCRFRFMPEWRAVPVARKHDWGLAEAMPRLPDHWDVLDRASAERPFRLVTAPARNFLNSTFNEAPTSRLREGRPRAKLCPKDLQQLGLRDGDEIRMGNEQGEIRLWVEEFTGILQGVVVVESIHPNDQFPGGLGINTLTSAEPAAPFGGAVFHDSSVWIRPLRGVS